MKNSDGDRYDEVIDGDGDGDSDGYHPLESGALDGHADHLVTDRHPVLHTLPHPEQFLPSR